MKLTVLGCYGPFPKGGGATSSYFLQTNNKKFVFDFGAGAFSRLLELEKPENLDAIFLSHLHFDHTSDMGALIYYFEMLFANGYSKKLTVIMPDDGCHDVFSIGSSPFFNVIKISDGTRLDFDGVTFDFYQMRHPFLSFGVKVSEEEKTFAYTGDTNICDNLERLYLGSKTVLADGAFLMKDWTENKPHLSVKHIVDITNKYGNKSIITHLHPKYTYEEIENEIKGSTCVMAREKKCYEI